MNIQSLGKHTKMTISSFFQDVKQCSELQARYIYQAFNSAVVERSRISPQTVDRLQGIISDELFNYLHEYLSVNYTRGKGVKKDIDKTNAGLPEPLFKRFKEEVEEIRKENRTNMLRFIIGIKGCNKKEDEKVKNDINVCYSENVILTPLKVIRFEGILSQDLYREIAEYVFGNYSWSERLDDDVERIMRKLRDKGKLGREKLSVKQALYKAYMLGV